MRSRSSSGGMPVYRHFPTHRIYIGYVSRRPCSPPSLAPAYPCTLVRTGAVRAGFANTRLIAQSRRLRKRDPKRCRGNSQPCERLCHDLTIHGAARRRDRRPPALVDADWRVQAGLPRRACRGQPASCHTPPVRAPAGSGSGRRNSRRHRHPSRCIGPGSPCR